MQTPRSVRRVLFLCSYNRRRSATAERLFAKRPGLEVRSAGTSPDAMTCVNANMLDWADIVFVMDEEQQRALEAMFPRHPSLERVVSLRIPDLYCFMDAELVNLLEDRVGNALKYER